MKRFKSAGQAQRFLSAHYGINNLLLQRHRLAYAKFRAAQVQAFQARVEVTGVARVA